MNTKDILIKFIIVSLILQIVSGANISLVTAEAENENTLEDKQISFGLNNNDFEITDVDNEEYSSYENLQYDLEIVEELEKDLIEDLEEDLIVSKDDILDVEINELEEQTLLMDTEYKNEDIEAIFEVVYDINDLTFNMTSEIIEDNEIIQSDFSVNVLVSNDDQFVATFTDKETGDEFLYDSTKIAASALPAVAYVIGGIIVKAVMKQITKSVAKSGLKFAATPLKHMKSSSRFVPAQLLKQVTKGKAYKDPRGSKGKAFYAVMKKNGKSYNLQVVYHKNTNTIYHFHYSRSAMGPLKKIK